MIKIKETDTSVEITGHAGYADKGKDIVCSAISALSQTFFESLDKLSVTEIKERIEAPGEMIIRYDKLTAAGQLLKKAFDIGVDGVAAAYPEYITVERADRYSVE